MSGRRERGHRAAAFLESGPEPWACVAPGGRVGWRVWVRECGNGYLISSGGELRYLPATQ